jgi:hypothetical protein
MKTSGVSSRGEAKTNSGFEFVEVTATVGVSVTVIAGNVVVAVVVLVTVT